MYVYTDQIELIHVSVQYQGVVEIRIGMGLFSGCRIHDRK